MDTPTHPVVNIADVELLPRPPGFAPTGAAAERYDAKVGFIGPRIGAKQLGYNITAISPGKRAFPFHNHLANEEMFFVLAGTGEIRIGDRTFPITPGDVIACPAGGKDTAHQIVNTGPDELRYLAVSTRVSPEIAEYPDAGSFGVLAERPSGSDGQPGMLMFIGREGEGLGYWENT
ncbi:cupin domain-containing protein [Paraburkholderia sp. GAS42]|uniref:cupin domain-containing protein n=1 Tax=Paraburkholderia sp. GAS42 TaxID=3035135 RepID=UPI003D1B0CB6